MPAVSKAEAAPEQTRRIWVSPVAGLVMIALDRGRRVTANADAAVLTRVLKVMERQRSRSRRLHRSGSPRASSISAATLRSFALSVQDGLGRNPHAGDLCVFRTQCGDLNECLSHDRVRLLIYVITLVRRRFLWPTPTAGTVAIPPTFRLAT